MAVSKVVYGATVLVDLTSDTVDAAHLAKGYTAHDAAGNLISGTLEQQSGGNLLSGITPSLYNGTTQNGKTYEIPSTGSGGTKYIEYELDSPKLTADTVYCLSAYGGAVEGDYYLLYAYLYYQASDGGTSSIQASYFFSDSLDAKAQSLKLSSGAKPTKLVLSSVGKNAASLSISNISLTALDL